MKRKYLITAVIAFIVGCFLVIPGCTQQELDELHSTKDAIQQTRTATTQAIGAQQKLIDSQRAAADALPPDSDERKNLEKSIAVEQKAVNEQQKIVDKANAQLARTDALITAIETGDTSKIAVEVAKIPVVGPYGALLAVILPVVFQEWRVRTAKKEADTNALAFRQTVLGLEKVLPQKSDDQKAALASIQDVKTQAMVESVKKGG